MKFDLKQSWVEVLQDSPRLQWEVLSVSYSLALLWELLPGTDVSLGFEPLPSAKLSFQTGVHCRQCKTFTELAQLGLIVCFTMCSEYFLLLIIIPRYSRPLLSSCLILWLKTMEFFSYCAFQPISSGQWSCPWKLLTLSHGQKKLRKKNKANWGYCRENYRFLHNTAQYFCLLASKALDEYHRKKAELPCECFIYMKFFKNEAGTDLKECRRGYRGSGGGKEMVGRFIVLVIMIIELELIEHSSCLNPHISMLLIIWKSYDKMRFYFLIAAECLIGFVSRPGLSFFSADSKQLIFGTPCTFGISLEYPAPWGPSDPSKHRHEGEGFLGQCLTNNHKFLWCFSKQLSKEHYISIQSYWNLQNHPTGRLNWTIPEDHQVSIIPFLITNKQSLQVIYKMHFWAKSALASQFLWFFKPFKLSTHFPCSLVK